MADLKNELTWSVSRHKLFDRCRRAYFYNYYLSWNGWNIDAPEENKRAYLLKNMSNLDTWPGQIVHNVINEALIHYKEKRAWLTEARLMERATELLRTGYHQSLSKAWQKNIKNNLNLLEHYYDWEITDEKISLIKDKVYTSLKNFLSSDKLSDVKESNPDYWQIPTGGFADSPCVSIGEIKVWTSFDFTIVTPDKFFIYDWKTGKPSDEDALQLYCYSLYPYINEYSPENITSALIYLYPSVEVRAQQFKPEDMKNTQKVIRQSYKEMKNLLDDPVNNTASIEHFPKAEKQYLCDKCVFQEICIKLTAAS